MKPLLLLTCGFLLCGCSSKPSPSPLVGSWRHTEQNRWFRFYADGSGVAWENLVAGKKNTYQLRYDQHTLHFHNLDEGWELRGSLLVVQEQPAGESTFEKLPYDRNPPEQSQSGAAAD